MNDGHTARRRDYVARSVFALFVCAIIAVVVKAACSMFLERDVFWHIRMGADLVSHGLSPFRDHYSFTFDNQPINWPPVAFQVLIFSLTQWCGTVPGVLLYKSVCLSLIVLFTQRLLAREAVAGPIQAIALVFLTAGLFWRNEARAELLSLVFAPIFLRWILDARRDLSRATIGKLTVALLVWGNYHTSAIFGYLLVGCLYLEQLLKCLPLSADSLARARTVMAGAVLMLAVSFLNPGLSSILLDLLATAAAPWQLYINEYNPLSLVDYGHLGRAYLALCACALIHSLWRRAWMPAALIAILLQQALATARLFPALVVLTLPFVAMACQEVWERWSGAGRSPRAKSAMAAIFIVLPLAVHVPETVSVVSRPFVRELPMDDLPVDVTTYLLDRGHTGRIFNDYGIGGFLINSLSPRLRVYIDGRTQILYPIGFMEHYWQVQADADRFRAEAEQRNIDFVIAPHGAPELLDVALNSSIFGIEYSGRSYSLLSRRERRFAESEMLLIAPECVEFADPGMLRSELLLAQAELHDQSLLRHLLEFVVGYLSVEDRKAFLARPERSVFSDRRLARLAGVLAQREGLHDLALRYLLSFERNLRPRDLLDRATLLIRLGQHEDAERVLSAMGGRGQLSLAEFHRLGGLLDELRAHGPLTWFNEATVSEVSRHAMRYTEWRRANAGQHQACRGRGNESH